jgi:hypothetical protein
MGLLDKLFSGKKVSESSKSVPAATIRNAQKRRQDAGATTEGVQAGSAFL